MHSARDILEFWFSDKVRPLWFKSTPEFDQTLKDSFEVTWEHAKDGKLDNWRSSSEGALALVIILDQFPLNMFRASAKSFSTEALSREVARQAIEQGLSQSLSNPELAFLYMPFMHSEDIEDQDYAIELFEQAGLVENVKFARHHRDIVQRFGRFPHRNQYLERENTQEEQAYLNSKEAFLG